MNQQWHYVYITGMTVAFFALPMLLLLVLYFLIITKLKSSGSKLRTRQVRIS